MLSKVRARHGIDLPVEKWRRSWGLTIALGALAFLFVLLPLAATVLLGLWERPAVTLIGMGSGLFALVALAMFTRT